MLLSLLWPAGKKASLEHTHLGVHEAGLHAKEGNHGEGRLGVQSGRGRAWRDHYPTSLCRQQYTTTSSLYISQTMSSHNILTPHYTPHHTTSSHHTLTLHHTNPPHYLSPHLSATMCPQWGIACCPPLCSTTSRHQCSVAPPLHTHRQTDRQTSYHIAFPLSGVTLPLPPPPPAHRCPEHAVRSGRTSLRAHPQSGTACEWQWGPCTAGSHADVTPSPNNDLQGEIPTQDREMKALITPPFPSLPPSLL